MTITSMIHDVTNVRVSTYNPGNNHAVTLIVSRSGTALDFTLFDLPEDKALSLTQALSDELTSIYHPNGGSVRLIDYLTERQVHKALGATEA